MGSRRSTVKTHEYQNHLGVLAHMYLVNHSKAKDVVANGHSSLASAKAEIDDSDEDKDEDDGNIEAEAPGGISAPEAFLDKWLKLRSCKEEEKEKAQEEEGAGQW